MTKLEEVARAIFAEARKHDKGFENFGYGEADGGATILDGAYPLEQLARTAIEALREPNKAMFDAGTLAGDEWTSPLPVEAWTAMIDAVLSEPRTSSKPLPSPQGPEMTQEQVEAMERGRK